MKPVIYKSTARPHYFVAHDSAREPGRVQLTRFDEAHDPTGHTTWDTAEEAGLTACGKWVRQQPPVGDSTFKPA
jgi:hypothetical protein